jgi:hypothetical protein
MLDKSKLGQRYVCHECGTKYYDLNRPEPRCPECSADPTAAAPREIVSLLARSNRKAPAPKEAEPEVEESEDGSEDDPESSDDSELFGEMDELDGLTPLGADDE